MQELDSRTSRAVFCTKFYPPRTFYPKHEHRIIAALEKDGGGWFAAVTSIPATNRVHKMAGSSYSRLGH